MMNMDKGDQGCPEDSMEENTLKFKDLRPQWACDPPDGKVAKSQKVNAYRRVQADVVKESDSYFPILSTGTEAEE